MEALTHALGRLPHAPEESPTTSTKVERVQSETWQITTTATLARLEQRADDQRDRLSKIETMLVDHTARIRILEDRQTGQKAVRKFSRSTFGIAVLIVSAASGFLGRYLPH